jgi:Arc/MetJ-type ribon-helix-helix transcriptional regulator
MTVESLRPSARPHITWTTLARAERLAAAGVGGTADHVMRRALDLLEQRHTTARGFTRAETAAALAGDDLEPDASRASADSRYREILAEIFRPEELDDLDDGEPLDDPSYLRQLLATAEALDPDPYGEQA